MVAAIVDGVEKNLTIEYANQNWRYFFTLLVDLWSILEKSFATRVVESNSLATLVERKEQVAIAHVLKWTNADSGKRIQQPMKITVVAESFQSLIGHDLFDQLAFSYRTSIYKLWRHRYNRRNYPIRQMVIGYCSDTEVEKVITQANHNAIEQKKIVRTANHDLSVQTKFFAQSLYLNAPSISNCPGKSMTKRDQRRIWKTFKRWSPRVLGL